MLETPERWHAHRDHGLMVWRCQTCHSEKPPHPSRACRVHMRQVSSGRVVGLRLMSSIFNRNIKCRVVNNVHMETELCTAIDSLPVVNNATLLPEWWLCASAPSHLGPYIPIQYHRRWWCHNHGCDFLIGSDPTELSHTARPSPCLVQLRADHSECPRYKRPFLSTFFPLIGLRWMMCQKAWYQFCGRRLDKWD